MVAGAAREVEPAAALRAATLGHSAILIDATPPRQFQFTGPTGLFSKALRDSALKIDVDVLRSMGDAPAADAATRHAQNLGWKGGGQSAH